MITHFKIFENKENLETIATNESYFSWEYDSYTATAYLLLDRSNDELYLRITKIHVKSGIGSGTYRSTPVFINVGTLQKADLALVRSLLKKNSYDRKFSTFWQDEEGNKLSLTDLIKMHKPEKPKKELKHIKPIDTFKEEPKVEIKKDIELVQYSDKAYALFGEGTKEIKDQLKELGCRYNRFLTDPKSGEKRAGWIFPTTKLNKIQEII
jgi:hypothetical protein